MITITKINEVYIKIDCEKSILYELRDRFSFLTKNYRYHPAYKNKIWDGKIRLFNIKTGHIYKGLYQDILTFAKEFGYPVNSIWKPHDNPITREEIAGIYKKFDPVHTPFDHQIESLYFSLKYQDILILSPTASGKSFFIYNLVRMLEKTGKGLIIVPTINLVEQLKKDFKDYSQKNGWNVDSLVHCIYEGKSKTTNCPVTISTWQSIYKLGVDFFQKYNYVIGDEVHRFTAESLKGIMEKTINAKYKIGMTGSLDESETNEMTLKGLFGPVKRVAHTHQLMEEGKIANLKINIMVLEHEAQGNVLSMDYRQQTEWFVTNQTRNRFIHKVVMGEKGNKLVLFQLVEKHGIPLYKMFKKEYPDREIYYISGKTPIEEREWIRNRLDETDDTVLIASYGTYSTGMNIPSLKHVFSTSPGKSRVRILQTIGRALRLNKDKTDAQFWDFADKMEKGKKVNIGYAHLEERVKLYLQEKFNIHFFKVQL